MAGNNRNLLRAKHARNDEWYTRYSDIEKEVIHYWDQLRGRIVYCPCDDYRWSNFVKYFKDHFQEIGLKRLIATNYNIGDGAYRYDFDGEKETVRELEGNGDFRSDECTRIKDMPGVVVVTNPPFSLMKVFIDWLREDEIYKGEIGLW